MKNSVQSCPTLSIFAKLSCGVILIAASFLASAPGCRSQDSSEISGREPAEVSTKETEQKEGNQLAVKEDGVQEARGSRKELSVATFGAGCYWCSEAIFQRVKGVSHVAPGFMGQDKTASYQQVVGEKTDFAEVCQVTFDPSQVTYQQLLEVYFQIHDPTSVNRQGEDSGPLYRSVIFYHDDQQCRLATRAIQELDKQKVFNRPIVTDVEALGKFVSAKKSEKDYYNKNRENKHCSQVILPKIEAFKKAFENLNNDAYDFESEK